MGGKDLTQSRGDAETRRAGDMTENEISEIILDAAISVHTGIGGPGLLESYYETALVQELRMRGLKVEEQKRIPIIYKGGRDWRPLSFGCSC